MRLIYAHHRTRIVKLAAVVRRREQSNQLSLGEDLVPVRNNLQKDEYPDQMTFP